MSFLTFRRDLTVKRVDGPPSYTNGIADPATKTNSIFKASVQPLNTNEMLSLPEGRREQEAFKLYTDFQLQTANESTGLNADIVEINGRDYEVMSVKPWQNNVINHYKAIVSLIT